MATKIQLRRDTAADWTSANPTLAAGEFGYESDTTKFKIGDGSTAWNSLAYKTGEGIKVVADDSATITVAEAGTLYVQGGSNVTTSTDSAGVLTINATGEVTGSSTTTFTNKTFDAEGTGNSLSNVDVANLKSGVLDTDLSSVSGSDDTLASAKAIKTYADTKAVLTGSTNNTIATVTGAHALAGEANLTFDGSTLAVTGAATVSTTLGVTGASTLDGITLADNKIKANRSNDSICIQGNGTGQVLLAANGGDYGNVSTNARYNNANIMLYSDLDHTLGTTPADRSYKNVMAQDIKLTASQNSSDSDQRWRNQSHVHLELNGSSTTATSGQYRSRGPVGLEAFSFIKNTSSTAATLGQASGGNYGLSVYPGSSGDLTITNLTGMGTYFELSPSSGDLTITDCVGYESIGIDYYHGSGTSAMTSFYHFRAGAHSKTNLTLTNDYAFFTEEATALSQFGAVRLMNQSGDPTGVADTSHIYAKDDGSSSEVYVRDEAGNVTKISPHNEAGEWEYYSVNKNTGKKVRVNMERMIKKLEQLTGETFIESE